MRDLPILYIVIPCYNEAEVIELTAKTLKQKLESLIEKKSIAQESKIFFVDDGSGDATWQLIDRYTRLDTAFGGLKLSKNCGHQNALLAGMMAVRTRADAIITIDANLQQDIEAIDDFLTAYMSGAEIVYGVRKDRDSDGAMKRASAGFFYGLMHRLGCNTITNHADYRLMSRKAVDALSEYKESALFLRGLIPELGFSSDIVYFNVKKRAAGKSKYTPTQMFRLALNGIVSMSTKPLQLIVELGLLTVILGIGIFISCLLDWAHGRVVPGWTTIVATICLFGGMTLLSQGVIGIYVGKTYMESKNRPRYHVDAMILRESDKTPREERNQADES